MWALVTMPERVATRDGEGGAVSGLDGVEAQPSLNSDEEVPRM